MTAVPAVHPLLAKLELRARLPEEDRALILEMTGDQRSFPSRRDIISEGIDPQHVHLVMEGWACRYAIVRDGKRQITALLIPGDICDPNVIFLGRMDHGIGTLGPAKVAFVARELMMEASNRPAIVRALIWATLVDEAVLRAWVVNIGRRQAVERVAHLICELELRLANVGLAQGGQFELPLTQEDMGDATGLTPVHINRVLRKLREDGLVTFVQHRITILDPVQLKRISGFDAAYLHNVN